MTIGNQLKAKRVELLKTQKDMSKMLDITEIQYNRLENDHSTPSYKLMQKFANKFRTTIHIYPKK